MWLGTVKGKDESSPEKDMGEWKPLMERALLVLFKISLVVGGMSATSFDDTLLFRHSQISQLCHHLTSQVSFTK